MGVSAMKAENSSNALRAHNMQTSCPCAVGTWLGHGPPDNGGHERIAAATSTLRLTSANAQDQQCYRSLRYFHTAEATGPCESLLYPSQGRPCGRPPAAAVLGRQRHHGNRGTGRTLHTRQRRRCRVRQRPRTPGWPNSPLLGDDDRSPSGGESGEQRTRWRGRANPGGGT